MKKLSILILSVLLITGLFISCDNSSAIPSEELVTITFDDAQSRSLSANLEEFKKTELYWAYTANKTDGGLTSGDTGNNPVWIHKDDPGLEGQIPGFSQGNWSFSLFAYKKIDTKDESGNVISTSYNKVYEGTNGNVTLTRDPLTSNKVIVTVSPVKDEQIYGTLTIKSSEVLFKPQNTNDTVPEGLSQAYKVTSLDGSTEYPLSEGKTNEWSLAPGAYNVTVNFVKDNIIYGAGTVVATIYSNLTTTVSGELVELLTHVEFDSELNPDVITKTVSSDEISFGVSDPVKVEKFGTTTDSKISAEVPADAVNGYISSVANEIEGATTSNTKVVFSLNVNTTEASSTGVTYDIGMSAVATIKNGENNIAQVTKQIKELDEAVTVKMQLQTGLTNVKVSHNLTEMSPLDSAIDTSKNGFFYDINSGILTIRTDSFSPFKVEYTQPASYAASVNNVKYLTLSAAVNAAIEANTEGKTILLLKDITENVVIPEGKIVSLDLNGYTLTNESDHTIYNKGTLTVSGNGTVDNVTHAKAALYNEVGATATLNGGLFTRSKENGISAENNGGNSYYAILNHGIMTINEGVSVVQDGQYSSLLENGWQKGDQATTDTAKNVSLTINGGTFKGGLNTIKNDDWGVLTINGGDFSNIAQHAVLNWNVATINGGTFECGGTTVYVGSNDNNQMDQGKLTVTGGTFNYNPSNYGITRKDSTSQIEITGGKYITKNVSNASLPDGYEAMLVGDKYVVQKSPINVIESVIDDYRTAYTNDNITEHYVAKSEATLSDVTITEDVSKEFSGQKITGTINNIDDNTLYKSKISANVNIGNTSIVTNELVLDYTGENTVVSSGSLKVDGSEVDSQENKIKYAELLMYAMVLDGANRTDTITYKYTGNNTFEADVTVIVTIRNDSEVENYAFKGNISNVKFDFTCTHALQTEYGPYVWSDLNIAELSLDGSKLSSDYLASKSNLIDILKLIDLNTSSN